MQILTFVAITFVLVKYSHQKSTPTSKSYTAAVVEFAPDNPISAENPPNEINAARYVSFIEKAAKQDADIIVFPECGLTSVVNPPRAKLENWTTIVPWVEEGYSPCEQTTIPVSETLRVISCAARDNALYVVVNLFEKVFCANESCPSDGKLYYNTNVVFDRDGKIIARYRKTNLFMEPGFNVTKIPEIVTFETDFGVTFGTFTCFDILFKKPALFLTRMFNVTDIVFPTAWFSEVPFLTALQTQAGWSFAEDANLLVSGYDRPKSGNSGSGIYLGRQGVAKAIIPGSETSEMLIAKVPKKNLSSIHHRSRPRYDYSLEEASRGSDEGEDHDVHDELRRKRSTSEETFDSGNSTGNIGGLSLLHDDLSGYVSHRFNSSIVKSVCDGDFCCAFDVQMAESESKSGYRLVVRDGTRRFVQPVTAGVRVCAVVFCPDEALTSCGNPERSAVLFNALTINATFPNYEDVLIMPSSLGPDLLPLPHWRYDEQWEDKVVHVFAGLAGATKDVVACGIYARDFSRDSWADSEGSKIGMQWATLTALAIVSIFLLFLYRKGWRKPWHRGNQLSSESGPYQNLQPR